VAHHDATLSSIGGQLSRAGSGRVRRVRRVAAGAAGAAGAPGAACSGNQPPIGIESMLNGGNPVNCRMASTTRREYAQVAYGDTIFGTHRPGRLFWIPPDLLLPARGLRTPTNDLG
jgi:hypothetical protein